jgi:hypothetical protein
MNLSPFRIGFVALFLSLGSLAGAVDAYAASFDLKDVTYSVEPIIGYELQRKSEPQPHAKIVLIYGARAVAGYKILSAEGEYTRGNSDEQYVVSDYRIEETTQKFRVGLRSQPEILPGISVALRGGAELAQIHTRTTSNGKVSEYDRPSKVYPYVGAGLAAHLGSKFSLSLEGLMSVHDWNDLSQNEYQSTVGLKIALNTK